MGVQFPCDLLPRRGIRFIEMCRMVFCEIRVFRVKKRLGSPSPALPRREGEASAMGSPSPTLPRGAGEADAVGSPSPTLPKGRERLTRWEHAEPQSLRD